MTSGGSPSRTVRTYLKALAVYGAGAWVAVEIIGFLASTYSLPRAIVDSAIVIAVAGGLATAVITWYHADPGRQRVPLSEQVILGGLATGALVVVVFLTAARDPARAFYQAGGARVVIEMPLPPPEESDVSRMLWAPPDQTVDLPGGWFVLKTDWLTLEMPGLSLRVEGHGVMYQEPEDSESGYLTVVLPAIPSTLRSLLQSGHEHETGIVEMGGLSLKIERPFSLLDHGDSIVVRVEGRFRPQGTPLSSGGLGE